MTYIHLAEHPNNFDAQYNKLVNKIMTEGSYREGRNGGTKSLFGEQLKFDLSTGLFPLLTTKKVNYLNVLSELLWFLSGSTDDSDLSKLLHDEEGHNTIWTANAKDWKSEHKKDANDLGKIYGYNWRSWQGANGETVDQIENLMAELNNNPFSRRLLVSAHNPTVAKEQALPACHTLFQVYVSSNNSLSLHMYQRSADVGLGLPYNIASYATLLLMIATTFGYAPGELTISLGDAHIYANHREGLLTQLSRVPEFAPRLLIKTPKDSIVDYIIEDFALDNYFYHPAINLPFAV